jgi:transcriptional regulator with XRE-family HTH domain
MKCLQKLTKWFSVVEMKIEQPETLGEYLRHIRESRNYSVRQAAKNAGISSAYLSQIESGKRGKRKTGEEHYGPHPQILKKLAEVYHVPASELMERAGYIEGKGAERGFSEGREIERIFDFVIRDPVFRESLTDLDKRAIVNRYEAITGKRLITWAGESNLPSVDKIEFAGIKSIGGNLYAETPHTDLTVDEVARELGIATDSVNDLIRNGWLRAKEGKLGELLIEKAELRQFKDYAISDGLKLRYFITHSHKPISRADYANAYRLLEKVDEKLAPTAIKRVSQEVFAKYGLKMRGKK